MPVALEMMLHSDLDLLKHIIEEQVPQVCVWPNDVMLDAKPIRI